MRTFSDLGREQQDGAFADAVWADIHNVLTAGPATQPGKSLFEYGVFAQQIAAELALDAEDPKSAHSWIAALDRWLDWSGAILGRAESHLLWARFHRLADDPDEARQHAAQALAYATDPRQPLALIAAQRVLGQLALEARRYDEAAEHLQASWELAGRCQAPYEQALTLLELAELAARTDDIEEVRRLLREARSICEQLGAKRSLARADLIEASLSKIATAHPAGLSAREVEVLRLLTAGTTDPEIAEALFIGRRTVATHVRHIYDKLNVSSRAEAAAWAIRIGIA
jgi:DNA-binding CsgD family transcriptional regulator